MTSKKFKLNDYQTIEISIKHPLFNNLLISNLANQDLNKIVHSLLESLNYKQKLSNLNGLRWYYIKERKARSFIKI